MSSLLTISKDLSLIIKKASTITERLNCSSTINANYKDDPQIENRLQQWCQVVAKGNLAKFEKRLAWDGLDIENLRTLMADDIDVDDKESLPTWANTLEQLLDIARNIPREQLFSPQPYLDPENPQPFEPFYIPCIQLAQQKLWSKVGNLTELLNPTAQVDLECSLLNRLVTICTSTLLNEFFSFRSSGNDVQDFFSIRIRGHKSQEKYRAFIDKLFKDGLFSLFEEYAALGRLVATAIDFWVEANAEFLNRLATDWSNIEQFTGKHTPLKEVVSIKASLSDPHNRGRSVYALKFDTELKIVYKPKSLGLDVAFYEFLSWCNQKNTQHQILPFKIFQILNRSDYGWMEYVESLPCEDETDAKHFYQRSGMLLCLLHILETTDCHYENIIANGEHPVLVDLETLLHHKTIPMDVSSDADGNHLALQQLEDSVLRTAMLPGWRLMQNNHLDIDMSGLGGTEQEISSLKFKNINTDAMDLGYGQVTLKQNNVPTLNGTTLSPEDYLEDLVTGFEQMYDFLLSHQDSLLAVDSPIMNFANQNIRYVFRDTNTYSLIQQSSYDSSLLRNSIDRSIGLDVLSRAFITTETKSNLWSLLAAELQAMEQLDIPFFVANSSSDCLILPDGEVLEIFVEPSFKAVVKRIKNLSTTDLTQQVEIIRGSYYARFIKEPSPVDNIGNAGNVDNENINQSISSPAIATEPLNQQQLVHKAITIAQKLQQDAIVETNGSLNWFGFSYRQTNQAFQFQQLNYGLYDGIAGVALFFAALTKITGEEQYRELTLSTLQPLRQVFTNSNSEKITRLVEREGINGTTGLGSMIYALTHISELLEDVKLLEDAQKLACLITPELIASDNCFDIMGGNAGVILSLLAFHNASDNQESKPLELAILCGEHLLKNQTSVNDSPRAWKTWKDKQITGFSQGAAGIIYALLRLYSVTKDTRFFEAATEAIAYEQSLFSKPVQNWLDGRTEEAISRVTWAHGSPGIGLARLGSLSVLDSPEIYQQIAVAIETTQKCLISDVDNLSWGNLGRLETLLVAASKLDRPELLTVIHKAVSQVINQAETQGMFSLFPNLPPLVDNPGFFHGNAGIGYQLLRIAYPDVLPSVLLWE